MIRYPDLQLVLQIHDRIIEVTGGRPGLRDEGGIRSVLDLVQASYFGVEAYPKLADKAA